MPKILNDYQDIKLRAINLNSSLEASKKKLKDSESKLVMAQNKLKSVKDNMDVQNNSVEVLKELIERFSREHIKKITQLLSFGLQTIFYDKNYEVEIDIVDKRNAKTAELYLVETKEDGSVIKSSFEDSIGGGVLAVVGFIFQIFYIRYFNQSPIVFCDESFSQLSEAYIDGLMEFLKQLSEKKGFKFVLISHDPRLIGKADQVYLVNEGEVKLYDKKGEDVDGGFN